MLMSLPSSEIECEPSAYLLKPITTVHKDDTQDDTQGDTQDDTQDVTEKAVVMTRFWNFEFESENQTHVKALS